MQLLIQTIFITNSLLSMLEMALGRSWLLNFIEWHVALWHSVGKAYEVSRLAYRRFRVGRATTSPAASTRRTMGVFSLYLRWLTLPASFCTLRIKTGRVPCLSKVSWVTVTGRTPS